MSRIRHALIAGLLSALLAVLLVANWEGLTGSIAQGSDFEELIQIFDEFREVQEPDWADGAPDYTAEAIERQERQLERLRARLDALDISSWPVARRVDYQLVRAEMNGLAFHHRVIRPWTTDADFYTPRVQDISYRSINIDELPLGSQALAEARRNLQAIPPLLAQAQSNIDLDVAKADGAMLALKSLDFDKQVFTEVESALAQHHPDVVPLLQEAQQAMDEYASWIRDNQSRMRAPGGVGKENYSWWMRNVWLMPYTWQDAWTLARREYDRTVTALKVEEFRNRGLPELHPVETKDAFNNQWAEQEARALEWVRETKPFSVPDELVPIGPRPYSWDEHPGRANDPLPFFLQVADRDPMMEIIHNTFGHNFDRIRMSHDSRPIRGVRRLYDVDRARSEAGGYTLEEHLMRAGIVDHNPRGREIILVAAAYRAVRAMADLKLHSNEMSYTESGQFEADMTPRGWASASNFTLWEHRRDYLREPGGEMSYLVGKVQVQRVLADRARQLGDNFSLQSFWDGFFAAGMIPVSLIRWEMTGLVDDELEQLFIGDDVRTASR